MPVPGPWIQPADMWLDKEVTVVSQDMFHRNIQWEPDEGATEEDVLAQYQAYWTAALVDDDSTFEGHASESGVSLAEATTVPDAPYPYAGFQNLPYSTHQSWAAFLDLQVDDSTDDHPMFEPDLPDGATVEYASDEGVYSDEFEYQIPLDVEGTYDAEDPLKRLPNLMMYGHSLEDYAVDHPAAPHPRMENLWAHNFTDLGPILAPWDTKGFYVSSPEIVVAAAFPVHIAETPHPDGADGIVYFGRHSVSTPLPYVAKRRYTPPAYRIVYENTSPPTLRQRQTLSGNTGGPPLRQRNNGGLSGGPSLRQRQTGL